jgi:hypothetical protein
MPNTEDQEEKQYLTDMLLDSTNNLWIAPEFVRHLRSVFERLPLSALQVLAEQHPAFLAVDPNFRGLVIDGRSLDASQPVIYLSPMLLSNPREEVESVIAHELAHVVLGHKEEPSPNAAAVGAARESEADQLVESWGFSVPESDKRRLRSASEGDFAVRESAAPA